MTGPSMTLAEVSVARVGSGTCDPWLLSEGRAPHPARALYLFIRDEPAIFESRVRCWLHRPNWARTIERPSR